MPTLQHLNNRQIDEVVEAASQRQVPVTITVRSDSGWMNMRSRLLCTRNSHLCLSLPAPDDGGEPYPFQPADKAGVSFKLKHHKHIFTATVAGTGDAELADGTKQSVLELCSPTRMHRLQRRAFLRVDVPPNRIVRASFWMGGRDAEPAGGRPDQPIWSSRVTNISAGGFQATCEDDAIASLDVGEAVGVHVRFGTEDETVYADAQLRHLQEEDGKLYVGFQFVGLAQTREGRDALQLISTKVAQFQRESAATARARR